MTGPGADPDDHVRLLGPRDVPGVLALEQVLFGPSAWTRGMVEEELSGPGRWYVGVDAAPDGDVGGRAVESRAAVSRAVGSETVPGDGVGGGRLVGYAGLWFDGDVAQVMTLGVAPGAQRRGTGRLLLDRLVRRARELGAQALLLEVRVDNAAALALYAGAGFEVLGRRPRYYQPEDVDAFTMRLALTVDDGTTAPGS